MLSALVARWRGWRLRRLRRRAAFLEARLDLFRRFPHNLGYEGLERVAAQERSLRRLEFLIGLTELRQRFSSTGGASVARVVVRESSSESGT